MRTVLILSGIILYSNLCFGVTINVPADQSTIQRGINVAVDGDTVLVAPGEYIENIRFRGKSVILISASGPEVTILKPAVLYYKIVRIDNGETSITTLSGFTLSGATSKSAIFIRGTSPKIEYNHFTGNSASNQENAIIRTYGGASPSIKFNIFYNNPSAHAAIHTELNDSVDFCNNTIDIIERGVVVCSDGSVVKNNIITGCSLYGFWDCGTASDRSYNNFWNNANDYYGSTPADPHDISIDPTFIDSHNGNYALLAESPCIDAGDPDPQYNDWDGTRNDIGALPLIDRYQQIVGTPDSLFAIQEYSILPETVTVMIGNLLDYNSTGVVNQASIKLNDSLMPFLVTSLAEYPGFFGEVTSCSFMIPEVLSSYGMLWDITSYPFVISGRFTDAIPFTIEEEITVIGHLSGDANLDGVVNIADAIFTVNTIFKNGPQPRLPETADANCDGFVNIADVVRTISFIFRGTEAPCHIE